MRIIDKHPIRLEVADCQPLYDTIAGDEHQATGLVSGPAAIEFDAPGICRGVKTGLRGTVNENRSHKRWQGGCGLDQMRAVARDIKRDDIHQQIGRVSLRVGLLNGCP